MKPVALAAEQPNPNALASSVCATRAPASCCRAASRPASSSAIFAATPQEDFPKALNECFAYRRERFIVSQFSWPRALLLSRMHETPKTDQKPKHWPWWASWALLGVAFTTSYWSHAVWNALPTGFWTLLFVVVFVFCVWRWIAFFAEKWRA